MNPTRALHLLIIHPDTARRAALAAALRRLGAQVAEAAEAGAARPGALGTPGVDLAVVACDPPGPDAGLACRQLGAGPAALPLILLGRFSCEADRVLALESGADDCVGPECSPRELLARARAILRRVHAMRPEQRPAPTPVPVGDWAYCQASRSLQRGTDRRPLTAVEHGLLAALTEQPGRPLDRAQILGHWRSMPENTDLRAVDTAVMRLRRLVEPDPARPRHIRTVRGRGYCFMPGAV